MEWGPIIEAPGANFRTKFLSAFGRQPAITRGTFARFSLAIRLDILCSVLSLTEQVTIIAADPSFSFFASSNPPCFSNPDIISESAILAEQPYASIQTFGIGCLIRLTVSISSGISDIPCNRVEKYRAAVAINMLAVNSIEFKVPLGELL